MSDDVSEDRPQHWEQRPLLFLTSVWVLSCPTELYVNKVCEMGPPVYSSYPRRLERLIICRVMGNLTVNYHAGCQTPGLLYITSSPHPAFDECFQENAFFPGISCDAKNRELNII